MNDNKTDEYESQVTTLSNLPTLSWFPHLASH